MTKLLTWIKYGGKIPRKLKKTILEEKISISQLKRQIKAISIIKICKTMYETPIISPKLFCPYCGETKYVGGGNMTCYPEHWEEFKCIRCRKVVAYIDNSPFTHILECGSDFKDFY